MRYWGDIELPDEDELAELEAFADLRRVDAPSQPESQRDEEWMLIPCQTRKKKGHTINHVPFLFGHAVVISL